MRISWRGRARKGILLLAGLVATWLLAVSGAIVREARIRPKDGADVVVVLGAAVIGDNPSPVLEERLGQALLLFREGAASKIILTGTRSQEGNVSEAMAGRNYLAARGVPAEAIALDESSRTTRENLAGAKRLMAELEARRALVVSDPLHMLRSRMMWEHLGIEARGAPTPFSRYRSFGSRARFLFRELIFLHGYGVFREE